MALHAPGVCLANEVLPNNLSNPQRSRSRLEIDLPALTALTPLQLKYELPPRADRPDNLAAAIFELSIKRR